MKKRFIGLVTSRYFIAPVLLLIWISFFDSNNIFSQMESQRQLQKLKDEKTYYSEKILEVRTNYKELSSDPKTMEKYARERYFMKKQNEEIFLIVEEQRKKPEESTWIPKTLRDLFGEKDSLGN
ncbi:MAG: septum formation initiator family protein [Bacteroidota bacterium]